MKNHVVKIISLRRRIDHKMPLHLLHSPLHTRVLLCGNPHQYLLNHRYVLHVNLHRKRLPIQYIAERRNVAVGDQHWNAFCINSLRHSWAGHLVATGAEAELALPHHVLVGHSSGELFIDLDVRVFVFPLVHKQVPDVAMQTACKECKNGPR